MPKFLKTLFILAFAAVFIYVAWYGVIVRQVDLYRYPLKYTETVNKYAGEYGLSPQLLFAVIKTESDFNEKAVSPVGAKGLMQLMDETNEWVASLMKETAAPDDAFIPEVNLKRGAYFLAFLYRQFGGWREALAAYNAGMGRVSTWLENPDYSTDGKTLDVIPFSETAEYVKRVLETEIKYTELYFSN